MRKTFQGQYATVCSPTSEHTCQKMIVTRPRKVKPCKLSGKVVTVSLNLLLPISLQTPHLIGIYPNFVSFASHSDMQSASTEP